jgi:hypothetical protein
MSAGTASPEPSGLANGRFHRTSAVAAHVALIAVVAFVAAILLDFVKAEQRGVARGSITLIRVGETVPIAIKQDSEKPVASPAPVTTTGCRP